MASMNQDLPHCWIHSHNALSETDCLCLGTGRFLRSVLVPAFLESGLHVALIQTRGTSFMKFMRDECHGSGKYPVDTVLASGDIQTDYFACSAGFSFGSLEGKQAFYASLPRMSSVSLIGVGVTEAGLASAETQVMKDLFELLRHVRDLIVNRKILEPKTPNSRICVINTDNVPKNGDTLLAHMTNLAKRSDPTMMSFLQEKVTFHNTMVDRITSQREKSNGMVPRAEPLPTKALVILDEKKDLPTSFHAMRKLGFLVRAESQQLQVDISLKLRIANGTHTALSHLLALSKQPMTTCLSHDSYTAKLWMAYVDSLFSQQILPAAEKSLAIEPEVCQAVYDDWRQRLMHPHFGLSTFFITQNGAAKGGIRLSPTVRDLVNHEMPLTVTLAFAFAVLLRWLTPTGDQPRLAQGVFNGTLSGDCTPLVESVEEADKTVEYAETMKYSLRLGWYEFKCACAVNDGKTERNLSEWLGSLNLSKQPAAALNPVRAYFLAAEGGGLGDLSSRPLFDSFVAATAKIYIRLMANHCPTKLLKEMDASGDGFSKGFGTACYELN